MRRRCCSVWPPAAKDDPKESNSLQIGDYALLYKGASIMEDSDGNDALVLTLDFTNNSKDSGSYVWSISETAIQNGAELAIATVFANSDSYDTVIDSQFTDVAPGETLELRTALCAGGYHQQGRGDL